MKAALVIAAVMLIGIPLLIAAIRWVFPRRVAEQRDLATGEWQTLQARVDKLTHQLREVTKERDALRRLVASEADWDSTWLDALGIPELSQRGGDET